jgi:alpha-glucosidase (family GH31 glycosyl hydrolase)
LATNYLALNYQSDPDEEIFGMGLQYSVWNLKGRQVPLISTEAGVGRGLEPITRVVDVTAPGSGGTDTTSYAPTPTFIN